MWEYFIEISNLDRAMEHHGIKVKHYDCQRPSYNG